MKVTILACLVVVCALMVDSGVYARRRGGGRGGRRGPRLPPPSDSGVSARPRGGGRGGRRGPRPTPPSEERVTWSEEERQKMRLNIRELRLSISTVSDAIESECGEEYLDNLLEEIRDDFRSRNMNSSSNDSSEEDRNEEVGREKRGNRGQRRNRSRKCRRIECLQHKLDYLLDDSGCVKSSTDSTADAEEVEDGDVTTAAP